MRARSACLALALALLAGCGKSISGSGAPPPADNALAVRVDSGPAGAVDPVNQLYATVTLCVPGTMNCTDIDHVLVDTGSTGLRLLASVLPPGLSLPAVSASSGDPLYDCLGFADSYVWGPVQSADVKLGTETASAIPVHLLIDPSTTPAVPADCPNGSPQAYSVATLNAKGVLGIGVFREDCGLACEQQVQPGAYYTCPAGTCAGTSAPLASQVQNPVAHFAVDNNGVQIQMPAVGTTGAIGAVGTLLFGIGTQSNNALGMATIIGLDPTFGTLRTTYQSQQMNSSVIDSGANALFFDDANIVQCTGTVAPGFYCPASELSLSAMNQGTGGAVSTVNFTVGNSEQLLGNNPSYTAYQNLAGSNSFTSSFVWGLPFFYGRHVYYAIEGQATSAGTGPFVAY